MTNLIKSHPILAKFIVAAGFLAVGTTALAFEPASVSAGREIPMSDSATYPVSYSDLDISKMRGAKTLYLRIRYAAEVVCENAGTWSKKEGQACVNKAVDEAVSRIDRPLLSQYHQLRTKGAKAGLVELAKVN